MWHQSWSGTSKAALCSCSCSCSCCVRGDEPDWLLLQKLLYDAQRSIPDAYLVPLEGQEAAEAEAALTEQHEREYRELVAACEKERIEDTALADKRVADDGSSADEWMKVEPPAGRVPPLDASPCALHHTPCRLDPTSYGSQPLYAGSFCPCITLKPRSRLLLEQSPLT